MDKMSWDTLWWLGFASINYVLNGIEKNGCALISNQISSVSPNNKYGDCYTLQKIDAYMIFYNWHVFAPAQGHPSRVERSMWFSRREIWFCNVDELFQNCAKSDNNSRPVLHFLNKKILNLNKCFQISFKFWSANAINNIKLWCCYCHDSVKSYHSMDDRVPLT